MSRTEIVGHPRKTTHNLQDAMSPKDIAPYWYYGNKVSPVGFEHHG